MKKLLYLLLIATFFVACGKKSNSGSYDNSNTETITENTNSANNEGYQKGYDDGYSDGYGWKEHGYSYNDGNSYTTNEGINAYKNGYSNGYDEGYSEGENRYKAEKMSDWHNWEDEDIKGFYVELEGCENSDQADYISREYYEGEYIEYWGRYFAKTSVNSGEFEIELGERVSSKLFAIKGTKTFIYFKWSTSLSCGDEGIIDVFASRGTFYEKPD